MEVSNHNVAFCDYCITNKSLEILTDYFDIVPDGNLFLQSGMPVFAIRMRYEGLLKIAEYYLKKHKININVHNFIAKDDEQFSIYYSHANMLYSDDMNILQYFKFDSCKRNSYYGIIFSIVNKNNRLMHAIPIVYGVNNDGEKVMLFMDPYFENNDEPDPYSATMVGMKYFAKNIPNVKIYCHNQHIQGDHHSCGIFACNSLKNILINNAANIKDCLKFGVITTLDDSIFYKTLLHKEILKFSQLSSTIKPLKECNLDVSKYKLSIDNYIEQHSAVMRYVKNKNSYDPNDIAIVDCNTLTDKKVNLKILTKGHEYAKIILNTLPENEKKSIISKYNPDYWLKLISLEQNRKKDIKSFRNILKEIKININNQEA